MTLTQATRHATKLTRRNDEPMYVVFEDNEYHVANTYNMDTFYLGLAPTLIVYPDGEIER